MTNKTPFWMSVAALLIGVIAIGSSFAHTPSTPSAAPAKTVGGGEITSDYPTIYKYGIGFNGLAAAPNYMNFQPLVMTTGQNQASWLNNTGKTVYVTENTSILTATSTLGPPNASSTLAFSVGTSTTATITDARTNFLFGSLIDSRLIATSTTNNITLNSEKDNGTNGQFIIPVAPGQYLIEVLENPYQTVGGSGNFENATSTNRGYNISSVFRYFY